MDETKESTEKTSSEEESTYLDSNQNRKESFDVIETFTSHETAVTSAAEHAKALIQAKFIVAIKKPRKIEDFRVKLKKTCERTGFAERVRYKKPIGQKILRGPSIKFSDEAIKLFGNVFVDKRTSYENDDIRKISVEATDLENNLSKSEEVTIKKTVERKFPGTRKVLEWRKNSKGEKVAIVKATDDELLTKEAALFSKSRRNLQLQLIPQDIIDEAIDTAIQVLNFQDRQDPKAAMNKLVDSFAQYNIMPSDLEDYLEHPIDKCIPYEIQELREIWQSISQGEAGWTEFVRAKAERRKEKKEPSKTTKAVQDKLKEKKDKKANEDKDDGDESLEDAQERLDQKNKDSKLFEN